MKMLDQLQQRAASLFGLTYRSSWNRDARRAAEELCRRYSCNADELAQMAATNNRILFEFAGYLTVGETYFFRHGEHFRFLADYAERRFEQAAPGQKLRIISSGCSSGEEPYSMAITLLERLREKCDGYIDIIGSDINEKSLEKARQGVYSAWSFRGAPPWLTAKYFTVDKKGTATISDQIRQMVTFEQYSTLEHLQLLPPQSIDAVFFRNVAIYLDESSLQRIFEAISRVLSPQGILVVAPADPRPAHGLFRNINHETSSIYAVAPPQEIEDSPRKTLRKRTGGSPAVRKSGRRPTTNRTKLARSARQNSSVAAKMASTKLSKQFSAMPKKQMNPPDLPSIAVKSDGEKLLAEDPGSKQGYLLRGLANLSDNDDKQAVSDLRSVVFLDGEDRLARFWYGVALQNIGRGGQALKQFRTLQSQLAEMQPDELLEDGKTTAAELAEAVEFLSESLK